MVGASAHHANAYPVTLIPAGISVDDIDAIPSVEVVNGTFTVDAPDLEVLSATAHANT
jgi:hypothetical protein